MERSGRLAKWQCKEVIPLGRPSTTLQVQAGKSLEQNVGEETWNDGNSEGKHKSKDGNEKEEDLRGSDGGRTWNYEANEGQHKSKDEYEKEEELGGSDGGKTWNYEANEGQHKGKDGYEKEEELGRNLEWWDQRKMN